MSSIAVIVGVSCSTTFSSGNLVIVYPALPALLLPHGPLSKVTAPAGSHVLQQWQLIFDRGHYTFPGNAILAASAFFYAGRQTPQSLSSQKNLYYLAAGLNLAVIPSTLIFVGPTNVELQQRAARARQGSEKRKIPTEKARRTLSDVDLIRWWGTLAAIRAVLPLLAITVAMAAAFIEFKMGESASLSTESVGLALVTATFIFMVVRFGKPVVKI